MMGDHLHAGQGRLLRRQLPHPADRPRPAPAQGRGTQGRCVHRSRRHPADGSGPCRQRRPGPSRRTLAGAVPRRRRAPADWRDAAHWEFDFRSIAEAQAERHFGIDSRQCNLAVIRTERFKYVHFGGGLPPLLFDLVEDPDETRNVADDPAYRVGAAGHGRAAARLACRTSRPVAGAVRADRRRRCQAHFIRCLETERPAPGSARAFVGRNDRDYWTIRRCLSRFSA